MSSSGIVMCSSVVSMRVASGSVVCEMHRIRTSRMCARVSTNSNIIVVAQERPVLLLCFPVATKLFFDNKSKMRSLKEQNTKSLCDA